MAATINPLNIYARIVGENKPKCPNCKHILLNENAYSFGYYIRIKWHTIGHACKYCYNENILSKLKRYKSAHNRSVRIQGYRGTTVHNWMKCE